ncbi:Unconventional myosin-XVB [Dissostichus eleginoides]|uniref:Unconventional myosin-XVB n=1 Tax=Dissostichus eleginoides TaxID=100907 RepID=A0AAD9F3U2_DISEL|nr:Unconventional myosin-XVB [Dissostichus eleginoides]
MANARAKANALLMHDSCESEHMETNSKGAKNALTSPTKPPVPPKKPRGDVTTVEAQTQDSSNLEILAAIGTLKEMMTDFQTEL